jgi:hypothetical protein
MMTVSATAIPLNRKAIPVNIRAPNQGFNPWTRPNWLGKADPGSAGFSSAAMEWLN